MARKLKALTFNAVKSGTLRRLIPCLMVLFSLVFGQGAFARPLVVLSDNTASYQTVLETLIKESGNNLQSASVSRLEQFPDLLTSEKREYYVAIGTRATDMLLRQLPADAPGIISTFIPRRSYQTLIEKHKDSPSVKAGKITAIYLDQPYSRQLMLARLMMPKANTLGVAFSEASAIDLPLLQGALERTGFALEHIVLEEDRSPIKQLQPLLEDSDIFLTLPDKAVFNRTTAKWILYISYRQRVPLLGFSRKYVKAGAAAGVYSSPEQIGKQTGELIRALPKRKYKLPASSYPSYFSVITNPSAAKNLRINLPSAPILERRLKEAEE